MFLEYFGLREQPFGGTPDPRFLYFGATHREALASLCYGIESGCGFLALIAPPGMGKTTLLFHLLEYLRNSAQTVFLFQTQCNSREMFRHLLNDLGIDSGEQDLAAMHESLNSVLLSNARNGRRVVVVIDEAQNLKDSVLETVRLLSDFETSQTKLLQIVLSGQPQLADKLSQPGLTQLRQRISNISRLHPFTRVETMVYIEYRLSKAGYSGPPLFSYAAADLIAASSKGIPRVINNLCFNALTLGFAKRQMQIDAATVSEVMADLDLEGLTTHRSAVPELSEDSLVSFDGISPSNELTYQDFHDAVRSAWGNGAPLKSKDRPAEDSPKWTEPNSTTWSADSISRMRLHTEESSPTSFELDHVQGEVDVRGSSSLPITAASTLPLTDQESSEAQQRESQSEQGVAAIAVADLAGLTAEPSAPEHQALQLEGKNIPHESPLQPTVHATSPQAIEDARGQKTAEMNSSFAPLPSKPSIMPIRGRANLWAPWRAALRTLQNVYKKEKSTAGTGRAIRGGTMVAVAFALTVSGLVFARRQHEFMQPPLKIVPVAPSSGSMGPSQPSAAVRDSQDSQMPPGKVSPPPAKPQQKLVVVTIQYGQTLGEVSLQHLGQFNPEVTREIQKSNPEIRDPDLIIAGTQILLPSPPVHADIRTPSPEDVPSRAEGQQ
jgi:type II secretory pathway predicted ATPase ExeA